MNTALYEHQLHVLQTQGAGNGGKPPVKPPTEIPVINAADDPDFYHITVRLGDVASTGSKVISSHEN